MLFNGFNDVGGRRTYRKNSMYLFIEEVYEALALSVVSVWAYMFSNCFFIILFE